MVFLTVLPVIERYILTRTITMIRPCHDDAYDDDDDDHDDDNEDDDDNDDEI